MGLDLPLAPPPRDRANTHPLPAEQKGWGRCWQGAWPPQAPPPHHSHPPPRPPMSTPPPGGQSSGHPGPLAPAVPPALPSQGAAPINLGGVGGIVRGLRHLENTPSPPVPPQKGSRPPGGQKGGWGWWERGLTLLGSVARGAQAEAESPLGCQA